MSDLILLHLSLIQNIGPATVEKLVAALSHEQLNQIYYFKKSDFIAFGLSQMAAEQIVAGLQDRKDLEKELQLIEKHGFTWFTLYSENYPKELKNIYLPPTVFYCKGNLNFNQKSIAIVGSRKADKYGQNVISKIVPELIENNWCIVSGGALGIDYMAHQAALQSSGNTIAVLGSGLLKPYPYSHKNLFESISQNNGAVISPFPLNMSAMPGNFPARNRIISGLSRACIVVQATMPSGALITARYALEQGKEVGAVPGAIDNLLSAGCHKLISDGAAIITNANDILALLNEVSCSYKPEIKTKPTAKQEKQLIIPATKANDPEAIILDLCKVATSFDELLLKTNLNSNQLQEYLLNMQLDGAISQNFTGLWQSI